jgi:MYXO-CTERM domain-containing protein
MRVRWLCGAALLASACFSDPEKFNDRQAVLLCTADRECTDWDYGIEGQLNEDCREARERELDRCNESCDYDEDAAQECIQELRKSIDSVFDSVECSLESADLSICAQVYTDCEIEDVDDPLRCDVQEPEFTDNACSVSPAGGTPAALLGLVFAAALRRRRR